MGTKRDIVETIASPGVEDGERSFAIAHVNPLRRPIVSNVVGIAREAETSYMPKGRSVQDLARTVASGHDQSRKRWNEFHPLRFPETTKAPDALAGAKVDDFDRAISECRNK